MSAPGGKRKKYYLTHTHVPWVQLNKPYTKTTLAGTSHIEVCPAWSFCTKAQFGNRGRKAVATPYPFYVPQTLLRGKYTPYALGLLFYQRDVVVQIAHTHCLSKPMHSNISHVQVRPGCPLCTKAERNVSVASKYKKLVHCVITRLVLSKPVPGHVGHSGSTLIESNILQPKLVQTSKQ